MLSSGPALLVSVCVCACDQPRPIRASLVPFGRVTVPKPGDCFCVLTISSTVLELWIWVLSKYDCTAIITLPPSGTPEMFGNSLVLAVSLGVSDVAYISLHRFIAPGPRGHQSMAYQGPIDHLWVVWSCACTVEKLS